MTHPPTSRTWATALLVYAFAVIMAGTTLPTPMYALYTDKLHLTVLTTTVIYAAYAGGVLAALLLFGRWSDVVGRRPVLIAGGICAIASAAVFLTAGSVSTLLVARVLSGLSAGLFTGTATAAIIEAVPASWRDKAAAVATVANVGGLGAGPLLAGVLVQYGPGPLLLPFALHIALTAAALIAVLCIPETASRTGRLGLQRLALPAQVRGPFALAAAASFAGFACLGLFAAVAPSFLSAVIGVDNHAPAGALSSAAFITSTLAQLGATRVRPQPAIALGCASLAAGMAALTVALLSASVTALILAAVLSGVGHGISFSRGLAHLAAITPADHRAEVSSSLFLVAYIAIALPVVGEGLAAQHWGLRSAGIAFAMAVAALALMCLVTTVALDRRQDAMKAGQIA